VVGVVRAGRIVALVLGCLVGVVGLGLLIAGVVATVAYAAARDDDGFFRTDEIHLATPTAAITSDNLELGGAPGDADWLTERGDFATVTLNLRPAGSGGELFAGIGPTADVVTYLASVSHDRVDDFDESSDTVTYDRQAGSATPAPPVDQTFWVAEVTTADPGALTWDVDSGDWTVVVMNADGTSGIEADVRVGIKLDWLLPVAIGLIVVGVVLVTGGTLIAVFATRTPRQQRLSAPADSLPLPPPPAPAAPADSPPLPPPPGPAAPTTTAAPPEQSESDRQRPES
jgi:hypothetical protein